MRAFGILADDLTGACDTGVQFAHRGARVRVIPDPGHLSAVSTAESAAAWDVTVLNCESRHASPQEARAIVQRCADWLEQAGYPLCYKKVDSTLRGNLVAELQPFVDEGNRRIIVAPAYPAQGRTLEGGSLYVDGVPLQATVFAEGGLHPARKGHLPTMLREGFSGTVRGAGPLTVHVLPIGAVLAAAPAGSVGTVLVADASDSAHLLALARALAALPQHEQALAVGSAGLASALAEVLLPQPAPAPLPPRQMERTGPVVMLIGTRNPATRRQAEALAALPGTRRVWMQPSFTLPEALHVADKALTAPHEPGPVPAPETRATRQVTVLIEVEDGEALQDSAATVAQRIRSLLGAVAAHAVRHAAPAGLVLSGGDIAASALEALGVSALQLGGEISPGMPLSWCVDGAAPGLPLITKAGGFGDPEALVVAAQALHGLYAPQRR